MRSSPGEIAHILFLDIVAYSKETTGTQGQLIGLLNEIVANVPSYSAAKESGSTLSLPTGDGMALLFSGDLAAPARCAIEILQRIENTPLRLRIGIHSGVIQRGLDISGRENVAGEGINVAQRLMDAATEGEILLSDQYAAWLVQFDGWAERVGGKREIIAKHGTTLMARALTKDLQSRSALSGQQRVVIVCKRGAEPDEEILTTLKGFLEDQGLLVFADRRAKIGIEWAREVEEQIRLADWVIAVVSDSGLGSELLEYELEITVNEHVKRGRPFIIPIRVGQVRPLEGPIGSLLNHLKFSYYSSPSDESRVLGEVIESIQKPPLTQEPLDLEPIGGAVPPDSVFYVERDVDQVFKQSLQRHESILLVKGPRQMGKTSLIGRGAKMARNSGWRVAITDFQKLSTTQLASEDRFYQLLAFTLASTSKFEYDFDKNWIDKFGPNINMDRFIYSLLESSSEPLVWFMDEADRLFGTPFASDFFGLVRSWHNSRATESLGPWKNFTVVMGYATEAHLFIKDLNQSPFNVGRQFPLEDFNTTEVEELNRRYGAPLTTVEVRTLMNLVGGQPYLIRRALDLVARNSIDFHTLLETAVRDDGPFGDHLKRVLVSVSQLPEVVKSLRASLANPDIKDLDGFPRLLSAGIVRQPRDGHVELRYAVYQQYLSAHFSAA